MPDFGFEPEVENLDNVPVDYRGLYGRDGEEGPFKLRSDDDTVKSAVSAITGLNQALKAARAEAKQSKSKAVDLSPLADFGSSPDEIKAAIQAQIEELQGKLAGGEEAKLNLDKIKQDLAAAHATETQAKEEQITGLQAQLHDLLVKNTALAALGDALDPELVMPFIMNQVKAVQEEGKYQVFVVDSAGDRRYSGVTGQPMQIDELVKEMKSVDKYKPLFKSAAPDGTGHRPGVSSTAVRPTVKTNKSSVDKIADGFRNRR